MPRQKSIRFYLFALGLGVAVPLVALLAGFVFWDSEHEEPAAAEIPMQVAAAIAADTSRFISGVQDRLAVIARTDVIRSASPGACDPVLETYGAMVGAGTHVALWDLQGSLICASVAATQPVSVAERDWFQTVVRTSAFTVSGLLLGKLSGSPLVVFAYPVLDRDFRLQSVLSVGMGLGGIPVTAADGDGRPSRATVWLVDQDGVVVAGSPDAAASVGGPFAQKQIWGLVRGGNTLTASAGDDRGGTLWGYAPVEGTPWRVLASLPASELPAVLRQTGHREAFTAAALVALLGAWTWVLSRLVVEPMQGMARVARRAGEGARAMRARVAGPSEIRELALSINEMLDRRDADEMALHELKETLALAQETSASGIWAWDIGPDRVNYSSRFKMLLGFGADEELESARSFAELVHDDDRERAARALEQHLDGGVALDDEFRIRCAGGSYRWFRVRGLTLRDDAGKPLRFVGSIHDISRAKRTELELQDSEERFQLAMRGAADGIWDWDIAQGRYYISAQYKALLGYADEELRNSRETFLEHLHPDDLQRVKAAVEAHLNHRDPYDTEYRLRCKDGSYIWFRGRGQAIWDSQGRPLRMAGSVSDITARKIAESALRESEAKYRMLLETSTDTVLMLDGSSRILFANHALTETFGYAAAEIIGEDISVLQAKTLRGAEGASIKHLLGKGEGRLNWGASETTAMHRDGREFPVEVLFSQLQLGARSTYAVFIRDISARKKTEAELRQSERLFREMADSAPALLWMAGPDGKYFYFNRPWLEFTGQSVEHESDQGWIEGVHQEDRAGCQRECAAAVRARRSFLVEYRLRRADGEYRWMMDQGVPRFDESGSFIGYLGSCVDITSRVEADDHIRRLSDMYAALSQVNDAIARANDQQRLFERVCQITARFTSFSATWIGLIDEGRQRVVASARGGQLSSGVEHIEVPLDANDPRSRGPVASAILGDRQEVWNDFWADERSEPWRGASLAQSVCSIAAFPLRCAGRVVGVIAVYSDRVEFFDVVVVHLLLDLANNLSFALDSLAAEARRKRAEDEIRELNSTLELRVQERTVSLAAANRELEAFSYSVSHDLRAPLRSIGGFSDILLESYADRLDPEGRNYLLRIKQASQRMTNLIGDMLNLARIARSELNCRPLELTKLAEEVANEIRQLDLKRDAHFIIARDLTANADPVLMRSVFENLLGNAWKFTSNRESARIEVGTAERAGQKFFYVRDNGAGFNMAYADRLFAPFQRLHSEHEFAGSGIGLATVQRIVHRHNGHIWVEAAENEGACFYFTLAA